MYLAWFWKLNPVGSFSRKLDILFGSKIFNFFCQRNFGGESTPISIFFEICWFFDLNFWDLNLAYQINFFQARTVCV